MSKVSFVIGAAASGKTHFIKQSFAGKDVVILDVYDYQQKAYDEAGFGNSIPMGVQFRCLMKANETLLGDIISNLKQGRDVVVEHTLFKAKRRIVYVDAIREAVDAEIEIYVMRLGYERWEENAAQRNLRADRSIFERDTSELEFPNPAEGFDAIYEVTDEGVNLRMDPPVDEQFLIDARKQITEEKERIVKEDEESRKHSELLESMKTRPFWHYCEVCGKKEFITDEEAFNDGWDYPPRIGFFGMLGPRTCGNCQMTDTLYWKIQTSGKLPIVIESDLNEEELITWRRIKGEPESLLEE
ncbi:MAG: ATP-binding protein [Lachnospiraceae bacterium]|nr:ATP-binding protein [Lachnospiraceae bacterium]